MTNSHEDTYYPGEQKVVLIVDDKVEVRELLNVVLTMYGYLCIEAGNGCEAELIYKTTPVDLIITDVYMPEKDGLSLISDLREIDPDVKIVAMSGSGGTYLPECLEWAKSLGAKDSFVKPFSHVDFVNVINSVMHSEKHQYQTIIPE
ncbi:MAG: response regulator [Candidatus Marinimicrobia bacterium]|nr:response regulator [Candidatus Neomarinimicrobiota bacterium]MCF7850034.1 response regulator [Candidatus Neomarinimicrobiota bacterium]